MRGGVSGDNGDIRHTGTDSDTLRKLQNRTSTKPKHTHHSEYAYARKMSLTMFLPPFQNVEKQNDIYYRIGISFCTQNTMTDLKDFSSGSGSYEASLGEDFC